MPRQICSTPAQACTLRQQHATNVIVCIQRCTCIYTYMDSHAYLSVCMYVCASVHCMCVHCVCVHAHVGACCRTYVHQTKMKFSCAHAHMHTQQAYTADSHQTSYHKMLYVASVDGIKASCVPFKRTASNSCSRKTIKSITQKQQGIFPSTITDMRHRCVVG